MHTETVSGTISKAFGNDINPSLAFKTTYEAYGPDKQNYTSADWESAIAEIKAANEFPSNQEIVDFVNNKAKANARQKEMQVVLDAAGYKKPVVDDSAAGIIVAAKQMYKTLLATKRSPEVAATIVATTFDLKSEDFV